MHVTLNGIDIFSNEKHSLNEYCLIICNFWGNEIFFNILQPLKAYSPILFTVEGIEISTNDEQFSKA